MTKISQQDMLLRLRPESPLLPPLVIQQVNLVPPAGADTVVDARIVVRGPEGDGLFRFAIEAKAKSTPSSIMAAARQASAAAGPDERPMVFVPYLAPERLDELEREGVSGIDLCGNGVVIVSPKLYLVRSGRPNQYPDSRSLSNPYRRRSALVARALLVEPSWPTLSQMVNWMHSQGARLSLAQASKAISALEDDLIVVKQGTTIHLQEPARLLDQLGSQWRVPPIGGRLTIRLPCPDAAWPAALSSHRALRWSVTGESSAPRYVTLSHAGPRRVAVTDLSRAAALIGGTREPVPNFADLDLLEIQDPGLYFATVIDDAGIRWASRLQTWLELQSGDARQQDAARDLRRMILAGVQK